MKFKSKKNKCMLGMLLALLVLGTILSRILFRMNLSTTFTLLFLCCIVAGFLIVATESTKYILEEEQMIISCMGIEKSILYDDIVQVREQNGFLTIQASSLPQVCIVMNNNKIVRVSPDNREDFINLLNQKRNKKL